MTGGDIVKQAATNGSRIGGVHLTFPSPTIVKVLARDRAAGTRVREDFMTYAWGHDLVAAGAAQLLQPK